MTYAEKKERKHHWKNKINSARCEQSTTHCSHDRKLTRRHRGSSSSTAHSDGFPGQRHSAGDRMQRSPIGSRFEPAISPGEVLEPCRTGFQRLQGIDQTLRLSEVTPLNVVYQLHREV